MASQGGGGGLHEGKRNAWTSNEASLGSGIGTVSPRLRRLLADSGADPSADPLASAIKAIQSGLFRDRGVLNAPGGNSGPLAGSNPSTFRLDGFVTPRRHSPLPGPPSPSTASPIPATPPISSPRPHSFSSTLSPQYAGVALQPQAVDAVYNATAAVASAALDAGLGVERHIGGGMGIHSFTYKSLRRKVREAAGGTASPSPRPPSPRKPGTIQGPSPLRLRSTTLAEDVATVMTPRDTLSARGEGTLSGSQSIVPGTRTLPHALLEQGRESTASVPAAKPTNADVARASVPRLDLSGIQASNLRATDSSTIVATPSDRPSLPPPPPMAGLRLLPLEMFDIPLPPRALVPPPAQASDPQGGPGEDEDEDLAFSDTYSDGPDSPTSFSPRAASRDGNSPGSRKKRRKQDSPPPLFPSSARSRWFQSDGRWCWRPCTVLRYHRQARRYVIRWATLSKREVMAKSEPMAPPAGPWAQGFADLASPHPAPVTEEVNPDSYLSPRERELASGSGISGDKVKGLGPGGLTASDAEDIAWNSSKGQERRVLRLNLLWDGEDEDHFSQLVQEALVRRQHISEAVAQEQANAEQEWRQVSQLGMVEPSADSKARILVKIGPHVGLLSSHHLHVVGELPWSRLRVKRQAPDGDADASPSGGGSNRQSSRHSTRSMSSFGPADASSWISTLPPGTPTLLTFADVTGFGRSATGGLMTTIASPWGFQGPGLFGSTDTGVLSSMLPGGSMLTARVAQSSFSVGNLVRGLFTEVAYEYSMHALALRAPPSAEASTWGFQSDPVQLKASHGASRSEQDGGWRVEDDEVRDSVALGPGGENGGLDQDAEGEGDVVTALVAMSPRWRLYRLPAQSPLIHPETHVRIGTHDYFWRENPEAWLAMRRAAGFVASRAFVASASRYQPALLQVARLAQRMGEMPFLTGNLRTGTFVSMYTHQMHLLTDAVLFMTYDVLGSIQDVIQSVVNQHADEMRASPTAYTTMVRFVKLANLIAEEQMADALDRSLREYVALFAPPPPPSTDAPGSRRKPTKDEFPRRVSPLFRLSLLLEGGEIVINPPLEDITRFYGKLLQELVERTRYLPYLALEGGGHDHLAGDSPKSETSRSTLGLSAAGSDGHAPAPCVYSVVRRAPMDGERVILSSYPRVMRKNHQGQMVPLPLDTITPYPHIDWAKGPFGKEGGGKDGRDAAGTSTNTPAATRRTTMLSARDVAALNMLQAAPNLSLTTTLQKKLSVVQTGGAPSGLGIDSPVVAARRTTNLAGVSFVMPDEGAFSCGCVRQQRIDFYLLVDLVRETVRKCIGRGVQKLQALRDRLARRKAVLFNMVFHLQGAMCRQRVHRPAMLALRGAGGLLEGTSMSEGSSPEKLGLLRPPTAPSPVPGTLVKGLQPSFAPLQRVRSRMSVSRAKAREILDFEASHLSTETSLEAEGADESRIEDERTSRLAALRHRVITVQFNQGAGHEAAPLFQVPHLIARDGSLLAAKGPSGLSLRPLALRLQATFDILRGMGFSNYDMHYREDHPLADFERAVNSLQAEYAALQGDLLRVNQVCIGTLLELDTNTALGEVMVASTEQSAAVLASLHVWARESCQRLKARLEYHHGLLDLPVPAISVEDFVALEGLLENFPAEESKAKGEVDTLMAQYQLLQDHFVDTDKAELSNLWECVALLHAMVDKARMKLPRVIAAKPMVFSHVRSAYMALLMEVTTLSAQMPVFESLDGADAADEHFETLGLALDKVDDMTARLEEILRNERNLGLSSSSQCWELIRPMRALLEPLMEMWLLVSEWGIKRQQWNLVPLHKLDTAAVQEEMSGFARRIALLVRLAASNGPEMKSYEAQKMLHWLRDQVEAATKAMPMVLWLCHPSIKQRHILELTEVVGPSILEATGEEATLSQVLSLPLLNARDLLMRTLARAMQEFQLEQSLERLDVEMRATALRTVVYHGDYCLVEGIEEAMVLLDDQMVAVRVLLNSQAAGQLERLARGWHERLGVMYTAMDELLTTQRKWVLLDAVFRSGKIRSQLPDEADRFASVDKIWKWITQWVQKKRTVFGLCDSAVFANHLLDASRILEGLISQVTCVLVDKRVLFPRFFFLSDNEILQIMSYDHDPGAANSYLCKVFDGISHVQFGTTAHPGLPGASASATDDYQKIHQVVALHSTQGNTVTLKLPITTSGRPPEQWLREVVNESQRTICALLVNRLSVPEWGPDDALMRITPVGDSKGAFRALVGLVKKKKPIAPLARRRRGGLVVAPVSAKPSKDRAGETKKGRPGSIEEGPDGERSTPSPGVNGLDRTNSMASSTEGDAGSETAAAASAPTVKRAGSRRRLDRQLSKDGPVENILGVIEEAGTLDVGEEPSDEVLRQLDELGGGGAFTLDRIEKGRREDEAEEVRRQRKEAAGASSSSDDEVEAILNGDESSSNSDSSQGDDDEEGADDGRRDMVGDPLAAMGLEDLEEGAADGVHETIFPRGRHRMRVLQDGQPPDMTQFMHILNAWKNELRYKVPGQLFPLVAHIYFCRRFEAALNRNGSNRVSLMVEQGRIVSHLTHFTTVLRGDLLPESRAVLQALVTLSCYQQELCLRITKDSASPSVESFAWQGSLRAYFDGATTITISSVGGSVPYGYEFIGSLARLFISPLTERVFLSMFAAMSLGLGGALMGPHGAGKSETSKELAKLCGRFLATFHGGKAQWDLQTVRNFFRGVAAGGLWACLKEFDALPRGLLSVVSHLVQQIHVAVASGVKKMELEGTLIEVKGADVWFCITMGLPHQRLDSQFPAPESLRVLFRPIAMLAPDVEMIMCALLMAEGFHLTSRLAQKLVIAYTLAANEVGHLPLDFGLRSMRAVVTYMNVLCWRLVKEGEAAQAAAAAAAAGARALAAKATGKSAVKGPVTIAPLPGDQGSNSQDAAGPGDPAGTAPKDANDLTDSGLAKESGDADGPSGPGKSSPSDNVPPMLAPVRPPVAAAPPAPPSSRSDALEESLLYTAIHHCNAPQLPPAELLLFQRVLASVFPRASAPRTHNATLRQQLERAATVRRLHATPLLVYKALQLHEAMGARLGVVLTGPVASGKSLVLNLLAVTLQRAWRDTPEGKALKGVDPPPILRHVHPKAVRLGHLYGEFSEFSHAWREGILSTMIRLSSESCRAKKLPHWLVLDGPVESSWADSLNSVLDDAHCLSLANGETIHTPDRSLLNIVFESTSLAGAAPSTLSRCGMVHVEADEAAWSHLLDAWLGALPASLAEHSEYLRGVCLRYLPVGMHAVDAAREEGELLSPATTGVGLFRSFLVLTEALLHAAGTWDAPHKVPHDQPPADMGYGGPGRLREGPDALHAGGTEGGDAATSGQGDASASESSQMGAGGGDRKLSGIDNWDKLKGTWMRSVITLKANPLLGRAADNMKESNNDSWADVLDILDGKEGGEMTEGGDSTMFVEPETLGMTALLAMVWTYGVILGKEHRTQFDVRLRKAVVVDPDEPSLAFPPEGTVFDYMVDAGAPKWIKWSAGMGMQEQRLAGDYLFSMGTHELVRMLFTGTLAVPTLEMLAPAYLSDLLARWGRPVLLTGPPSTGKSQLLSRVLRFAERDRDAHTVTVRLSRHCGPEAMHMLMMRQLEQQGRLDLLAPAQGKPLMVLVDDLSLPVADASGEVVVAQLVRQLIESGGWYPLQKTHFVKILRLRHLATLTYIPGTRARVPAASDRLLWHYHQLGVPAMSSSRMAAIFCAVLHTYMREAPTSLLETAELVGKASVQILKRVKATMLPTPARPHYQFGFMSLLQLFRGVFLGMNLAPTPSQLIRLWMHENLRTFGDGLMTLTEKEWFAYTLDRKSREVFGSDSPAFSLDKQQELQGPGSKPGQKAGESSGSPVLTSSSPQARRPSRMSEGSDVDINTLAWRPGLGMKERAESLEYDDLEAAVPELEEHGVQPLYGDYYREEGASVYIELGEEEARESRQRFHAALNEYNRAMEVPLQVTLFPFVFRHLLRIMRALQLPGTSLVLLGHTGSGRRSLTCLAAYMLRYEFFKVNLSSSYSRKDWLADLKAQLRRAGLQDKHVVLFLAYTSDLSKSGDMSSAVASAGDPEGHEAVVEEMGEEEQGLDLGMAKSPSSASLSNKIGWASQGEGGGAGYSISEDIDQLLRTSQVVGLFEDQDLEDIQQTIVELEKFSPTVGMEDSSIQPPPPEQELDMLAQAEAVAEGKSTEAAAAPEDLSHPPFYDRFVHRVRARLHIVVTATDDDEGGIGSLLRDLPGLARSCAVDVVEPWPLPALTAIANQRFLGSSLEMSHDLIRSIVTVFSHIHGTVETVSRGVSTASASDVAVTGARGATALNASGCFTEMLSVFERLLSARMEETNTSLKRFATGSAKLRTSMENVAELQLNVENLLTSITVTNKDLDTLLKEIAIKQRTAAATHERVTKVEEHARKQARELEEATRLAQEELDRLTPMVDLAMQQLEKLNKKDLSEIKSLVKPPPGVKIVTEALCVLLERKPVVTSTLVAGIRTTVLDYWPAARELLGQTNFQQILLAVDKDDLKDNVIKKVEPYMDNPQFHPTQVGRVSKACMSICTWIHALVSYHRCNTRDLKPKMAQLALLQQNLSVVQAALDETHAKMMVLDKEVKELAAAHKNALARREQLRKQYDDGTVRVATARTLFDGLALESARWEEQAKALADSKVTLVGDCVLAAGFVAYLGMFIPPMRAKLLQQWKNALVAASVPFNRDFAPASFFYDSLATSKLAALALPTDTVSLENAATTLQCHRVPFILDTEGQGLMWLRRIPWNQGVEATSYRAPNYTSCLQDCMVHGKSFLLHWEGVGEVSDSFLFALIIKQADRHRSASVGAKGHGAASRNHSVTQGGSSSTNNNTYLKLKHHRDFRIFITCTTPQRPPELERALNFIDFSISRHGLESQMLSLVSNTERPSLERSFHETITLNAEHRRELLELENKILDSLGAAKSSIIGEDDQGLIEVIGESQKMTRKIEAQLRETALAEARLAEARLEYRAVAEHIVVIYFCVADMLQVHPLYHFHLSWFVSVCRHALLSRRKAEGFVGNVSEHARALCAKITTSVVSRVSNSLFAKHHLLFTFLIALRLMDLKGNLDQEALRLLLSSHSARPDKDWRSPWPSPPWLEPDSREWYLVCRLSSISRFSGLAQDMLEKESDWRMWVTGVGERVLPGRWGSLPRWEQMVIGACLLQDKVISSVQRFVGDQLGERLLTVAAGDIKMGLVDASNATPLLCIHAPALPVKKEITNAATVLGHDKRLRFAVMGTEKVAVIEKKVAEAAEKGQWLVVDNIHQAGTLWLTQLFPVLLESLPARHDDFRLILCTTVGSATTIPFNVIQHCVKVILEEPQGVKATIQWVLSQMPDSDADGELKDKKVNRQMLYQLCVFHALVRERRKFGPIGWVLPYAFTHSDFQVSLEQIKKFIDPAPGFAPHAAGTATTSGQRAPVRSLLQVPDVLSSGRAGESPLGRPLRCMEMLLHMLDLVAYGAHVSTEADIQLMHVLLKDLFPIDGSVPQLVTQGGIHLVPPADASFVQFKKLVHSLPVHDEPEIMGLSASSDAKLKCAHAAELLSTTAGLDRMRTATELSSRPGIFGQVSAVSGQVIDMLIGLHPPLPEEEVMQHLAKDYTPMGAVLAQEVRKYNRLRSVVYESLDTIRRCVAGGVALSTELEQLCTSLVFHQVPSLWSRHAYQSVKPLGAWLADLHERMAFMLAWAMQGMPRDVWAAALWSVEGFITGLLHQYALIHAVAIDSITYTARLVDEEKPVSEEGVFLCRLVLEGADWEPRGGYLLCPRPRAPLCQLPRLWLRPCLVRDVRHMVNELGGGKEPYSCPVYRTPLRWEAANCTDASHLRSAIMTVNLPFHPQLSDPWAAPVDDGDESPNLTADHWVKLGVAICCSTAD
eukprot:jgi/Mesvir1/18997/Mv18956-RA.1